MKKVIALLCVTTLLLFSFVPFTAEASDNILRIVDGYLQSSIQYAYDSLTDDQKDICDYLVGCYNLTYLGARGFNFASGEITDFNSFQVTVKRLGQRIMSETGLNAWGSRMSDVFCQYVSSCIQYAQQQTTNFSTWYTNLPSDFSIPYGKENFDAWNNFYNDISNDGISAFQVTQSNWNSGMFYDFAYTGYQFVTGPDQDRYNNFVLNNSPLIYTNVSGAMQIVFSNFYRENNSSIKYFADSLYIMRDLSNACFGNSENVLTDNMLTNYIDLNLSNNKIYTSSGRTYMRGIVHNNGRTLKDLIAYMFDITPYSYWVSGFHGYYYLIEHVYLVDNFSSFGNKEEIFNIEGASIYSNDSLSEIPKENMLFYIKQLETDLPFPYPANEPVPIRNIVINNTYNYYGEQADPSTDFESAVIDRSAQSFSEPYSVDEGIFTQASEYIMYLWENTKPLVLYTKDLLECFTITPTETDEETDGNTGLALAIYGSLAVGVAGGLISKLLL